MDDTISKNTAATIFVTGATGFVGRNLVEKLISSGNRVRCLVRKSSRADFLKEMPAVEVFYGDLFDETLLRQCISGVSTVYHVAGCVTALTQQEMLDVNAGYTRKIAEICAEQPTPPVVVYVSSLAAAGPSAKNRPHVESDVPAPVSHYGISKLAAENALREYADRVPISVVRPGIVFGRYDVLFRPWLTSVKRTGIFFVPAYRSTSFSLVPVDDVIQIMLAAAECGERLPANDARTPETDQGQGIYYAASPPPVSYLQMGKVFGKAVGRRRVITVAAGKWIFFLVCRVGLLIGKWTGKTPPLNPDKYREAMAEGWACSGEKAERQLGVPPEMPLEEALKKTAEEM